MTPNRMLLLSAIICSLTLAIVTNADATVKMETVTVAKTPAWNPNWIYGIDFNFNSMTAGVIQIYDGAIDKFVGQVDSGFTTDGMAVSPDHHTIYVPGIYYSRGTRGKRTDVLEASDTKTLKHLWSVKLPPKHAQTIPTAQDTSINKDGHYVYVTNITPATTISVVDVLKRQFVGEINTSACVQAYPYGENNFFSMCPDGSILQIRLGPNGKEMSRNKSAPFFSVEKDPVFINGLHIGDKYLFVSFNGNVYTVDLAKRNATFLPRWSLLTEEDKKNNWRPGGYQVDAYNAKTGLLYILMHQGDEATHKQPGNQIWVYDLADHKLISKWDLPDIIKKEGVQPPLAIQVSQVAKDPILFAATADSNLMLLNAETGQLKHVAKPFGATTMYLINP